MTETVQQLSSLAPQVAIAVIFAYVVIKITQQHAGTMSEKNQAFLEESKENRGLIRDMTNTTNAVISKLSSSIDANTTSTNANTSITKETKELMGRIIDKL